jgi:hypothetical protein
VFGLPVNFISDHQGVVAETGCAFIYSLQQVLQHHCVGRIRKGVSVALAYHVHRTGDHLDILRGNGFDDIIEHTNPRPDWHSRPCTPSMEDLVAMELHVTAQSICSSRCGGNSFQLILKRDCGRSVEQQSSHGEPAIGVGLVHIRQQHRFHLRSLLLNAWALASRSDFDAIRLARELYERERQHPTPVEKIVQYWGYKGMTGPAGLSLAALKKFGLMTDEGKGAERVVA